MEVYILPSFIPLVWGYDMNELRGFDKNGKFSIIDGKTLKKFEVIIYNEKENKEYNFGKLGKLIKH
jgi:metallophosphoesterase superfamily enzyme